MREESIYNLIPSVTEEKTKKQRYNSKFSTSNNSLGRFGTSKISQHQTMGLAKEEIPDPKEFLKSHQKEPRLPEKKPFKYTSCEKSRRPPIPTKNEVPVMGIKTQKDFVKTNALSNIMSVPRMPEKRIVDTRRGDAFDLETSGLAPHYLKKKDFGEVPKYLTERQCEMERARESYDSYLQEKQRSGALQVLDEDTRKAFISGLKSNWEEIHLQYQGLSVLTDTIPKMHRKEKMESEMKQLEKDIEVLENHKVIYITN